MFRLICLGVGSKDADLKFSVKNFCLIMFMVPGLGFGAKRYGFGASVLKFGV